ncbi:MAG: 30S ribosomal protein S12 methylthiotransferase RimO [Nitrospinota bacterium]
MKNFRDMRVHMVSLGCAKNRVDSEKILSVLQRQGCETTDDPGKADLILINSCGFIGDARRETIDTVLEMAEHKKPNGEPKLAVMGCMVERFREEMEKEMPEIDAFWPLSDSAVSPVYAAANSSRALQPGLPYAYLKIAEGCGSLCSFCSIPLIRGGLKSRPMEDIEREANSLMESGIKEICLVAQDTTRYGADIGIKNGIETLLRRLASLRPPWLRMMYAYPTLVTDDLIRIIASTDCVAPYLDIPFQHIDNGLLKAMNRHETEGDIMRLIEKIRKEMPDGAIRSSFIVGFPGETEKNFAKLEKFIQTAELDHVGVFAYSHEEGTAAAELPDDVPEKVKQERKARIMELQRSVSEKQNRKRVGRQFPALVERFDMENSLLTGRLITQAPEIDGELIFDECGAAPGDITDVRITSAMEYDLTGKPA